MNPSKVYQDHLESVRHILSVSEADRLSNRASPNPPVESIAEWLQRPLLALTVADLGILETKVEQALVEWFELAEAWNAVLLIDEADLFLERRMNRDLARNGLVTGMQNVQLPSNPLIRAYTYPPQPFSAAWNISKDCYSSRPTVWAR